MRKGSIAIALALAASVGSARAQSVAEVFKRVQDSVVVIHVEERDDPGGPGTGAVEFEGLGSGVLIAKDRVLTAAHVVQVADRISVDVGGETLAATVVNSEPSADVALIQLERPAARGTVAELGDSDAVQVGDQVLVVGAPLGMSRTLSVGHVSARRSAHATYGGLGGAELLQTDASINPGNSGGPMFDMNGKVIGIVSHIIFQEAGAGGLGFVVTSNLAKELVLSGRKFWSGMEGYTLEGAMAKIFQLPQARGILVQKIAKGSPAEKVGLIPGNRKATIGDETFLVGGDVILSVMGLDVSNPDFTAKLRSAFESRAAGTPIKVVVLRGGRTIELELR
jgi:serine protease Do